MRSALRTLGSRVRGSSKFVRLDLTADDCLESIWSTPKGALQDPHEPTPLRYMFPDRNGFGVKPTP